MVTSYFSFFGNLNTTQVDDAVPDPSHELPPDTKSLLSLRLDKVVNDRVQEHSADTDGAAKELHGIEALAKDEGNTDDHDDTLRRVGNRLSYGILIIKKEKVKLDRRSNLERWNKMGLTVFFRVIVASSL